MVKTNALGQVLYPFSVTDNARKLFVMYDRVLKRISAIENEEITEEYPGELDILKNNRSELDELTELCRQKKIIYIPGNLLSRAKEWINKYDAL